MGSRYMHMRAKSAFSIGYHIVVNVISMYYLYVPLSLYIHISAVPSIICRHNECIDVYIPM